MCYVCHCFSWILDLFQRCITFFLACWVAIAVCLGLTVAVMAGIAYGYNYKMAELITHSSRNVSVYMRRGLFYEFPEFKTGIRRRYSDSVRPLERNSDGNVEALRSGNPPDLNDYDVQSFDDKASPLSSSLQKARDSNKYVQQLVKYDTPRDSEVPKDDSEEMPVAKDNNLQNNRPTPTVPIFYHELTTPHNILTKLITVTPNVVMSTAYLQSGSSQIVMRNFQPVEDKTSFRSSSDDDDHRRDNVVLIENNKNTMNKFKLPKTQHTRMYKEKRTRRPKLKTRFGDKPQSISTIRMRHWKADNKNKFKDDFPEELYEDELYNAS